MRVSLDFTLPEGVPADVGALRANEILRCTPLEVKRLAIAVDSQIAALGEACKVTFTAGKEDEVVFSGNTRWLKHIGRGQEKGRLVVDGDAGYGAGLEMCGGELEILGNAGDCLGAALHGGLIHLGGTAGDWCAASLPGQARGMTGGTILVGGSSGAFTGMGLRRGLVWVGGCTGPFCGERLLAGTILCGGKAGPAAGRGMKRGSIVAGQMDPPLPGFRAAGRADNEWLRISLAALQRLGVVVPPPWLEQSPWRYTGDHLELGKGEQLAYDLT